MSTLIIIINPSHYSYSVIVVKSLLSAYSIMLLRIDGNNCLFYAHSIALLLLLIGLCNYESTNHFS